MNLKLSPSELRTVRVAFGGLAIVLAVVFGARLWKNLESRRLEYSRLVQQARSLEQQVRPYQTKVQLITNLMERFHLDPATLSRTSLVAAASAAIQKTATSGGVQLGPLRESPAKASAKEAASIQLEGSGPVPAVISLLHRLQSVGYPLILESVQLNPDPSKPSQLKVSLTIAILDFDQWKPEDRPNA